MRADIFKHWPISVAILFSVGLVGGVYLFVRDAGAPMMAEASTETELLRAIAGKDDDADGLPNWSEGLYGTDPDVADTFHLGVTDGEAVAKGLIVPKAVTDIPATTYAPDESAIVDPSLPPAPAAGTLTAIFAQNFFTLFMAAREANGGADLTESQMNDVANQTMEMFLSSVKPTSDYKSMRDLAVSGSGAEAMKAFAASAEAVFRSNKSNATMTDIDYLRSAVMDGNTDAYEHILSIAKGFRSTAAGLAVLPVPKELAEADLLLINTMMRMSQLDVDFTKVDSDPLVAILALQQYQTVTVALGRAFIALGDIFRQAGISLPSDAPGAALVNMMADIEREQAATKP